MFHSLEPRRLLSALAITGTPAADSIFVTQTSVSAGGASLTIQNDGPSTITIAVDGVVKALLAGQVTTNAAVKSGSLITAVTSVDLQAGNDQFVASTSVPVTVLAGDGNDSIFGGSGNDSLRGNAGDDLLQGSVGNDVLQDDDGNDTSYGEAGNDTLTGYEGDDLLVGATGDDTYLWGTPAAQQTDTIYEYSGEGSDTLSFAQSAANSTYFENTLTVNLTDASALAVQFDGLRKVQTANGLQGYIENVIGTPGLDDITGNDAANSINGGDGNDQIVGSAGNDTVHGGAGFDRIDGGAGDDRLYSDGSTAASEFNDSDALTGGDGNDSLVGGDFTDALEGGNGNDTLAGGKGDDIYLFTTAAKASEIDTVTENAGGGTDRLQFEDGFDSDTEVPVSPAFGAKVNLASADNLVNQGLRRVTTPAGLQTNIENVLGGVAGDTITGNSSNNDLSGGLIYHHEEGPQGGTDFFIDLGTDVIVGGGGNDTLGGWNNDSLTGGSGNDTFNTSLTTRITPGAGTDTQSLYGYGGLSGDVFTMPNDLENLTIQNFDLNRVYGNALNNYILARNTTVIYDGGEARISTINGGAGNDTIESEAGDPTDGSGDYLGFYQAEEGGRYFEGGSGNDLLIGNVAPNLSEDQQYLRGGSGADTLESHAGEVWADYSDQPAGVKVDMNATGAGMDVYLAGARNIRGTKYNDTIIGDANDNAFDGLGGSDQFTGNAGLDTVSYLGHASAVRAAIDDKADSGTAGENDLIHSDIERITGTDQNDTLTGGAGNDTLNGLGGADLLDGGAGNDVLQANNQLLDPEESEIVDFDTLFGGAGVDTAVVRSIYGSSTAEIGAPVTLDNIANDLGGSGQVQTENVDGASDVTGDSGPNALTNVTGHGFGGAGNDTLVGASSDIVFAPAILDGGLGADQIRNGIADYRARTNGVAVSFNGVNDDGEPGEHDNVIPYADGLPNYLIGGQGNDTLVGDDGPNIILGLGGNDTIIANGGDDRLIGGAIEVTEFYEYNEDTLVAATHGPDGNDSFSGGAGVDTLDYTERTDGVRVTLDGVANDGGNGETDNAGTGSDIEQVIGGSGNDNLTAGNFSETLLGGSGNDILTGGSDRTTLIGGDGADTFNGGSGVDSVTYSNPYADSDAASVNVSLDGVANDGTAGEKDNVANTIDVVVGTNADAGDKLTGGPRPVQFVGNGGRDTLTGGPADDLLTLGGGTIAYGLGGDDIFVNQNGASDTISGGDGFDRVQDDDIDDTLPGLQNDTFGDDVEFTYDVIGAGGLSAAAAVVPARASAATTAATSTVVVSGVSVGVDAKGVLRVIGSANADTIELHQVGSAISVFVGSTQAGSAIAASTLRSIDVESGAGNDTVRLATAKGLSPLLISTRVHGGDGNDTLRGGNGGDVLAGEGGNDSVTGGTGNDVVGGDFVVLKGESVPPAALTPDGSDTLDGGGGDTDLISYTNRTTAVTINMAAGTVVSGKEKDTFKNVEQLVGSQANDVITGSAANDLLFAGPGDDTLTGGAGSDQLRSGIGTDSINADAGSDFIDTGPDNVVDRIVGKLLKDSTGVYDIATSASNVHLFGTFNNKDYFTLTGRYFGSSDASD